MPIPLCPWNCITSSSVGLCATLRVFLSTLAVLKGSGIRKHSEGGFELSLLPWDREPRYSSVQSLLLPAENTVCKEKHKLWALIPGPRASQLT